MTHYAKEIITTILLVAIIFPIAISILSNSCYPTRYRTLEFYNVEPFIWFDRVNVNEANDNYAKSSVEFNNDNGLTNYNITSFSIYLTAFNGETTNPLNGIIEGGIFDIDGNIIQSFGTINSTLIVVTDDIDFNEYGITKVTFVYPSGYVMQLNEGIGITFSSVEEAFIGNPATDYFIMVHGKQNAYDGAFLSMLYPPNNYEDFEPLSEGFDLALIINQDVFIDNLCSQEQYNLLILIPIIAIAIILIILLTRALGDRD